VREVKPGVWHWEAPHPEWKPGEDWGQTVSSYAIDTGGRLLLFDPLALPPELEERASAGETAIVLTCPWHARDARVLAERLGAEVYAPPPDEGDPDPLPGRVFEAGDRLPVGVEALAAMEPNDLVLWVESHGALVVGDTLIDRGNGLEIPAEWASRDVSAEQIRERLQPLRALPAEHLLATHGGPFNSAALERALG
jgi:glyoxylase-like metal-dependent hydrolase (beta-lactamase superfamily II)